MKPAEGLFGDLFEGSRFFEQMSGSGDDHELLRTGELRKRVSIHADYRTVVSSYEQERRRGYLAQIGTGQIRPSSAGDHRLHVLRVPRGGLESCAGSCAGAEIAYWQVAGLRVLAEPGPGQKKTVGEEVDVEHFEPIIRLVRCEEIHQQGCERSLFQVTGDELVPRAEASAAAAMGKGDDAPGPLRESEHSVD